MSRVPTRRRAATLMELMIFITLTLLIVGAAWKILRSGTRIGKTAVEGLALQSGIRNLLENMTRDVNAAFLIGAPSFQTPFPDAGPEVFVEVYQHFGSDAGRRIELPQNQGSPYPFGRTKQANGYTLPALRVAYVFNREARTVTRAVASGLLQFQTTPEQPSIVRGFGFNEGGQSPDMRRVRRRPTVMAREVELFEAHPIAFDLNRTLPGAPRPALVLGQDLPDGQRLQDRTVGIALRVRAAYRREQPVKAAQDSSMEILTKIYSYPKLGDVRFPRYFSSVDGDLRF